MREAVTRMVAAGQGKRVPITGASEYHELRRAERDGTRSCLQRRQADPASRLRTPRGFGVLNACRRAGILIVVGREF